MTHGTSGTAITDYSGRLLALESNFLWTSAAGNTEYFVRLDKVDELYEELKAQ